MRPFRHAAGRSGKSSWNILFARAGTSNRHRAHPRWGRASADLPGQLRFCRMVRAVGTISYKKRKSPHPCHSGKNSLSDLPDTDRQCSANSLQHVGNTANHKNKCCQGRTNKCAATNRPIRKNDVIVVYIYKYGKGYVIINGSHKNRFPDTFCLFLFGHASESSSPQ